MPRPLKIKIILRKGINIEMKIETIETYFDFTFESKYTDIVPRGLMTNVKAVMETIIV